MNFILSLARKLESDVTKAAGGRYSMFYNPHPQMIEMAKCYMYKSAGPRRYKNRSKMPTMWLFNPISLSQMMLDFAGVPPRERF